MSFQSTTLFMYLCVFGIFFMILVHTKLGRFVHKAADTVIYLFFASALVKINWLQWLSIYCNGMTTN